MVLPDKIYNAMKWIMFLGVPIGTFIISVYQAILTGDVVAIITAIFGGIATLAGVIIKISDSFYKQSISDKVGGTE